jgi:hypothetical protein
MRTKKDILGKLAEVFKTMKSMHRVARVSQTDRKLVPSVLRNRMYRKLIVKAIREYHIWLDKEVRKRKKKDGTAIRS